MRGALMSEWCIRDHIMLEMGMISKCQALKAIQRDRTALPILSHQAGLTWGEQMKCCPLLFLHPLTYTGWGTQDTFMGSRFSSMKSRVRIPVAYGG